MKKSCRLPGLVLGVLSLLSLPGGCASMDEVRKKDAAIVLPPPVEKPQFLFHRAREGETMASIAAWYAGDEAMVSALQAENPDLDPIKPGTGAIVKVPVFLAVVHDEPPDQAAQPKKLPGKASKAGSKATKAVGPRPPTAIPEVLGPK